MLTKSSMKRAYKSPFSVKPKKNPTQKTKHVPSQGSQRPILKISPVLLTSIQKPDLNPQVLGALQVQREADRVFLAKYAPAGVVIDQDLEILQFRGDTSDYLRQAPGAPSLNLFKMAREGLLPELKTALEKVLKAGVAFKKENIRIKTSRGFKNISIEVVPLKVPGAEQCYFLILFIEPPAVIPAPKPGKTRERAQSKPGSRERELEEALAQVKEELLFVRTTMQAHLSEWESANEEAIRVNHELQSSNEELQTAKEELQSSNEEITTVNDELQGRNHQLTELNDDFGNLTQSIQLAVVIVNQDLRVRFFTPASDKVFNLVATDVGRPISDIKQKVRILNLEGLISQVIKDLTVREQEVQDEHGVWYELRIRPYRTSADEIAGAVLTFTDVDDHKKNLAITDDYRHFLEAMIQTVNVSLLVLDSELKVKMANECFCRTFNVSAQQVENQFIYDLGDKQWGGAALRKLLEDVLPHKRKFVNYEVDHEFKSAGPKIMLLSANQIESGQSILVSIEDVTVRKQSERFSAHLAAIVEASDDAIISKNTDGMITSWNKGAERLFGYTLQEAVGQPVTMLIPPAMRNEEREIYERLESGKAVRHYEAVRLCKDGSLVEVSLTTSPIKDTVGRVIGASKIARDITEHKRAEEAVLEAGERFRFMAESMPQKIFTTGPNGDVDYFNKEWLEFTGLAADQLKGWGWTQLIHPEDLEENIRRWTDCLKTGKFFQYEHRFRRADGVYRWHLSRAHAMRDEEERIIMWIGSNTEIEEQKKVTEDLKELAGNLDRSNKDLAQFAHVSSHDLQEPLSTITNYVDLLVLRKKDKLDEEGVQYLEFIQEGALHAQALIQGLLKYASITTRDYPLEWTEMDDVLKRVLSNLQSAIQEKNALILGDPLPKLKINSLQITQVLQNLISNGIKYSGEKPPEIHISARQENQKWIFSISDNGIGIDPQYKERVFMIFKRLHSKNQYPGTGIGLATCKKIVQQHGGEIWVESEPQKGAAFHFSLPVSAGVEGGRT